ncbi:MAG: hypothetical protein RPG89_01125 [Microcystis panniformis WG22]|nr:hypothetical protein [Microcystis panniformis WG22]
MESKITIFCVVDVVESLSGGTLGNGNLCMMDNSPFESLNQGTSNLCTKCVPGQTIYWHMVALDLQTPVAIRNISFFGLDSSGAQPPTNPQYADSDKLHVNVWEGIVPDWLVPGVEYKYRLELQMYEGKNSILYVDTPSLKTI